MLPMTLCHIVLNLHKLFTPAISCPSEDLPVGIILRSVALWTQNERILKYVRLCCRGHVDVTKAQRWQVKPARTESDLEQLEAAYRILDLYIWLSFRMEAAFTGALLKPTHKPSAA